MDKQVRNDKRLFSLKILLHYQHISNENKETLSSLFPGMEWINKLRMTLSLKSLVSLKISLHYQTDI